MSYRLHTDALDKKSEAVKPSPLLQTALDAAAQAADIARRYYQGDLEVEIKEDRTPVTAADVECEQRIKKTVSKRFPAHGFFGEETGQDKLDAEYLWLVDPIDGTKSFVRQQPFFSTQIAVMKAGEIIVGVSSAPIFDELACAEKGQGAWLNGKRCRVSEVQTLAGSSLSSGNLGSLARDDQWQAYGRLVATVDRVRGYGDFYHYHLLASGRIDLVVESDVNILDIAALSLIVEEAGGRFTDLRGAGVGLETSSVLASNAVLHAEASRMLQGGSQ